MSGWLVAWIAYFAFVLGIVIGTAIERGAFVLW